jgi:hypothetical protein
MTMKAKRNKEKPKKKEALSITKKRSDGKRINAVGLVSRAGVHLTMSL